MPNSSHLLPRPEKINLPNKRVRMKMHCEFYQALQCLAMPYTLFKAKACCPDPVITLFNRYRALELGGPEGNAPQNLPGKLSQLTKLFCFDIDYSRKNILF